MSYHELKPLVKIGKAGLTAAVVEQVKLALKKHKVIKVKFLKSAISGSTRDLAEALAAMTNSSVLQVVGFTVVLKANNI